MPAKFLIASHGRPRARAQRPPRAAVAARARPGVLRVVAGDRARPAAARAARRPGSRSSSSKGACDDWPGWIALGVAAFTAFAALRARARVLPFGRGPRERALTRPSAPARVRDARVVAALRVPVQALDEARAPRPQLPYVEGGRRRLQLDVWHDNDDTTGRPCLLYVPGGAWMVGISNKNQQGKPLLIEMATKGWVCFAMNYPVSPRAKFPDHIVAVKRAIAWIKRARARVRRRPELPDDQPATPPADTCRPSPRCPPNDPGLPAGVRGRGHVRAGGRPAVRDLRLHRRDARGAPARPPAAQGRDAAPPRDARRPADARRTGVPCSRRALRGIASASTRRRSS